MKEEGSYYISGSLEKMCHLQVSLLPLASGDIVTSKRYARHLQVTDKIKGSKKVFQRSEKSFFHLRKIIAESIARRRGVKQKNVERDTLPNLMRYALTLTGVMRVNFA